MNRTFSQTQQKIELVTDCAQPISNSSQKEAISYYKKDSLWSNFRYGLSMLAILVIPPLIPDATVRSVIMGYMFVIVGIYTIIAMAAAIKTLRPTKTPKRGR